MKQASMLLRDIGYAKRLMILDTHLLWYFRVRSFDVSLPLSGRRYLELEEFLLDEADKFRVLPEQLDAAIWAAVRAVKANQCSMQFA